MAEALLDKVLGKLGSEETPAYEVLEKYVGKDLEYKEYGATLRMRRRSGSQNRKRKLILLQQTIYVTMSDGTGIVHNRTCIR